MDTDKIKKTIAKALTERSELPPYEDLCALHEDLVRHIEALTPLVTKQVDGLWHGSVEWYQKRPRLDIIPHEVGRGLGTGLQSATWHVKSLGYTLRFLLENSGLLDTVKDVQPSVGYGTAACDGKA
ncbi:DUF6415 family natural product biosynthesis protein [Streptomyces sp. NPDC058964]|uniref:DUF6415 family natural product biosynthesis protein n=1 Tax=Streptomyces sp. NPDC058964 TaxID=3346681 RepID=UPI003699341F